MADLLRFSTCVKECPTEGKPVECKEPSYMIDNPNYGFEKCTYTIMYEYTFNSQTKREKIFDIRYPTEVVGGKVCFPTIDPNAQDEMGKMINEFYNQTLSQLNESGVTDYINDTLATW